MESLIKGHWLAMGEFDPEHHIKLVVDDWGPAISPAANLPPGINWNSCLRCATLCSAA